MERKKPMVLKGKLIKEDFLFYLQKNVQVPVTSHKQVQKKVIVKKEGF